MPALTFLSTTTWLILVIDLILFTYAIYLRRTLFQDFSKGLTQVGRRLNKQGSRIPQWVEEAETSYRQASQSLETVNTAALIDQFYSQDRISLFLGRVYAYREAIENFLKVVPGLLLSLGLFGTFWGICTNLLNLSTILQLDAEVDAQVLGMSQVWEIMGPSLQSMATAFSSSLIGLSFSIILTGLVYTQWDTELVKDQLLSSVENYLDNVVQPTIEGTSRFDRSVDRMNEKFSSFLRDFGQTVRDAVNDAMQEKIGEIVEVNTRAAELTIKTQNRFFQSAESLRGSAEIFEAASTVLQSSALPDSMSRFTQDLSTIQDLFLESVESIQSSSGSLQASLVALFDATEAISQNSSEIQSLIQLLQPLLASSQKAIEQDIEYKDILVETTIELQESVKSIESLRQENQTYTQQSHEQISDLVQHLETLSDVLTQQANDSGDRQIQSLQALETYQQQLAQASQQALENYQNNFNQLQHLIGQIQTLTEKLAISSQATSTSPSPTQDSPTTTVTPSSTAPQSDGEIFKQAQQYLASGNLSDARSRLSYLLGKYPSDPRLCCAALELELKAGNLKPAERYWQKVQSSKNSELIRQGQQILRNFTRN